MTEVEWLAATDPTPMLGFLGDEASGRKRRLFGCACCRRVWDHLERKPSRGAVEAAEAFADGSLDTTRLRAARKAARNAANAIAKKQALFNHQAISAAHAVLEVCWPEFPGDRGAAYEVAQRFAAPPAVARELQAQAVLLRDIFGNPFRPVTADPAWLTDTVVQFARGIYDERAFDRMPILADALQDAGCENADVLDHCRGPGPHARGCWVVDLVLGKA
jgi:hypothetical protein